MTSLDECMQARIRRAYSFYLGIDDFGLNKLLDLISLEFIYSHQLTKSLMSYEYNSSHPI